jgi:oligopeptide transport system ATP-binding protein
VSEQEPILSVRDLRTSFPVRSGLMRRIVGHVDGVSNVSFDIPPGQTLALVGESGSGKSTVARTLVGLEKPSEGMITFRGKDVSRASSREIRQIRREMQMVFQDPFGSLNPRKTVRDIIAEAWLVHPGIVPRKQQASEVDKLLFKVGLSERHAKRYPHQFSGGQRQRIAIARALATRPSLIICDESVAALDVSVQAQIINLLKDLQRDLGLSYLFIAHDLAVVRQMSDVVAVMYLGRIVEMAPQTQFFDHPLHPYSRALLSAVPRIEPWRHPEKRKIVLNGEPPSQRYPPRGCAFRSRCWEAQTRCQEEAPALRPLPNGCVCACHVVVDALSIWPQPTVNFRTVDELTRAP